MPASKNRLDDRVRTEIVTRLAMFDTITEIHKDLLDRGYDVSKQAISHYVPGNNRQIAKKWLELYDTTREKFLHEVAKTPIAERAYRLRQLGKIHEVEMKRGNTVGARATLEQAAKEVGNVFTNLSKVSGAVLPGQVPSAEQTIEEQRNILADRLAEGLARMKAQQSNTPTQH